VTQRAPDGRGEQSGFEIVELHVAAANLNDRRRGQRRRATLRRR
jgi:hypothetical protein